ncbi:MAG: hypothetical protein ACE5K4_11985 [Candidatus Hydrothermarchaeota archaeon]
MEYPSILLITYIETLANISGPSETIDWLKDIAETLFEKIEFIEFRDMEEFKENISEGKTFLPYFTNIPEIEDNLLLFKVCPFYETLWSYIEYYGRFPPSFEEIVEYYKEREDIAVSPFCIIHRFVCERIGEKIRIGNKRLFITRLGSKSVFGEIIISRKKIEEKKLNEEDILGLLKDFSCIYYLEAI